MIVQPIVEPMEHYTALIVATGHQVTVTQGPGAGVQPPVPVVLSVVVVVGVAVQAAVGVTGNVAL